MTFNLSALGMQSLDLLTTTGIHYSSEAADQAFTSMESEKLGEFFTAVANKFIPSKGVNYQYAPLPPVGAMATALNQLKYTGVKNTAVQIPVGLNIMLDQYVTQLEKLTVGLDNLPKYLDNFYVNLGKILNTPDLATAQTTLLDINSSDIPSKAEYDQLKASFDGSERTEAPFGAVADRVTGYIDLYVRIDTLNRKAAGVPIDGIFAKMSRFDPLIRTLRANLIRHNVPASGPFVSRLIDQASILAAAAELAAGYKHAVSELVEATRRNYTILVDQNTKAA